MAETVDEYMGKFPLAIQQTLQKLRQTVKDVAPEAVESISYGMPAYKLHGPLVYFAAYKNHIGFYPVPSGIEHLKTESALYIKGKGTLQFPLDQPIPYDLIKKIVKYRVKENLAKANGGLRRPNAKEPQKSG